MHAWFDELNTMPHHHGMQAPAAAVAVGDSGGGGDSVLCGLGVEQLQLPVPHCTSHVPQMLGVPLGLARGSSEPSCC